ncbi:ATP phosphoribosyltransferase regulatory subunit [Cupriavidus gilardii J11]|uniref:ATP phosphoribosyltransferase regulatory subunit n=1 Tax=Cupriavidus gilardii J11 TaxID=936133 RepID=A0A562BMX4_9BURK|nr:ATP phosphoribosyltransferase regulatory subunit [Cupriavidus gilardii]TWG86628.1 ATP phosphoribosyltransferase regulatory subunit [Cupriavidus gilardii J11]
MSNHWLLPENIADVLPSEARKIEELRRRMLDLFRTYGYELVMPPMLEYLESLLTGTGHDLDLRTFKLVDQLSGRTMGLRADITPQVARIDAHLLNRPGVTRLCYAGNVLHARPAGFHATREPIQVGAEIYGHAGLEADVEIQNLMLAALQAAGLGDVRLDLCHAGIVAAVLDGVPSARRNGQALFDALENKDVPGLRELTVGLPETEREALLALPTLYGGVDVIDKARAVLPASPAIGRALDELAFLSAEVRGATVNIDLADLRGYHYHSGVMFAAYVAGLPNYVARGGRYDKVGEAFGRARPATGFSLDLREVAALSPVEVRALAIFAPWDPDPALRTAIAALREGGEIVIQSLPGHTHELDEFNCDRQLVRDGGRWVVVAR